MANKSRETANLVSSKTGVAVTISGDPVILGVGNTELVRVTGSGHVGIGTTNPAEELHLYSSKNSGTVVKIENPNTGIGANGSLRLYADAANVNFTIYSSTNTSIGYGIEQPSFAELSLFTGNGFRVGTRNATPFILGTNDTEALRIDSSQRVGIGTTNPTVNLQIEGKFFARDGSSSVYFEENLNGAALFLDGSDGDISGGDYYGLIARDGGNDFSISRGAAEFVRINSNGYVGIGTTNPIGLVQVGTFSTTMVYINPIYGSVGIGTNDSSMGPDRKLMLRGASAVQNSNEGEVLDITGSFYNQIRAKHNGTNFPTAGLLLGNSDETYDDGYHHSTKGIQASCAVVNVSDDALHLGTNNSSRMVIDHEGRLGIGTTSVLTSTWGNTAPGSSTTGTQVVTIFGNSPAINIIHDGSQYTDTSLSAINFGRRAGTTNPYRATIAYHQKLDWLKIYANNRVHIASNGDVTTNPGSNSISVTPSGIGIGTTVPGAKLHVSGGNIKVDSGYGIDFSATSDSSGTTDAEILDDFEEGSWTPVFRGSGTAGTYEADYAVGWYRKIGDMVTARFRINFAASVTGGGTGQSWITGLPYTAKSASLGSDYYNNVGTSDIAYMYSMTISGTYGTFIPRESQTYCLFISYDNAGNQYIDSPMVGNNDIIGGCVTYIVA